MPDFSACLVYLGATVVTLGAIPYLRDTLAGRTLPNRVSWLMWSLPAFIAASAAFSEGAGLAALPILLEGILPFMAFLASFLGPKKGWTLHRLDYACGALSLTAIGLWYFVQDAGLAVGVSIMGDLAAALPTLLKAWKAPQTETPSAFLTGAFSAFTALFVIQEWRFAVYGFPVYLLALNSFIFLLLLAGRRRIKN